MLEHRLAHAHQRLDVPRRGAGGDDHHVRLPQPFRQRLLERPRRVHHGDLGTVRLLGAVQGAALGVQVVEAHGDAGALEGECYLVGDQGLAHAALLVAYQNRLHIAHLAIHLINYAFPYLIISPRKGQFNCHFLGFSWAFRGLETGFLTSPGTARFPHRLVNERMPKTAVLRPLRVHPSKALLQVSSRAVSGPAPLEGCLRHRVTT